MKERFENYINKKFKSVRDTQEVLEIKEELVSDLLTKSKEMKTTIGSKDDLYEYDSQSLTISLENVSNNFILTTYEFPEFKVLSILSSKLPIFLNNI